MLTDIFKFATLANVSVLVLLLSCMVGLRYWKRWPGAMRILVIFLVFNFCIELGARLAGHYFRQNLPLLHLYTFGEFLLLSLFYRQILSEKSYFVKYFKWIFPIVLALIVLNTLCLQGIFEFNSFAKTLVNIFLILFALDYAFRLTEVQGAETQEDSALRWINAAILLYYCGSIFVFMSSQFELETGGALKILWQINAVLNLVFQIVILTSLWKVAYRHRK